MKNTSTIVILLALIWQMPLLAVQSEMTLVDERTGKMITVNEGVSLNSATDLLLFTHDKSNVDDSGQQGHGSVVWNGRNGRNQAVASGLYFARLESGGSVDTKKIILAR